MKNEWVEKIPNPVPSKWWFEADEYEICVFPTRILGQGDEYFFKYYIWWRTGKGIKHLMSDENFGTADICKAKALVRASQGYLHDTQNQ